MYLYLAAGNDPAQAQTALRMSQSRVDLAAASLRQMGLTQDAPKHLAPAEAPSYTEQDVTREDRTNPEFPSMVGEAQRRLGRLLSTEEIKILLSVYRYLGLPPEVISILINYCIQRSRARGQTRMPSIRSIEKEAYRWADLGIDTTPHFDPLGDSGDVTHLVLVANLEGGEVLGLVDQTPAVACQGGKGLIGSIEQLFRPLDQVPTAVKEERHH